MSAWRCSALVWLLLLAGSGSAEVRQGPETIVLVLPQGIDMTGVHVEYLMRGAFGGSGGPVRQTPDVAEYPISTRHDDGRRADTLEASVFLPGYQLVLLDLTSLLDETRETLSVPVFLQPLPSVLLSGRIEPMDPELVGLEIGILFNPRWRCGPDCSYVPWILAVFAPEPSGRFSIEVPDLTRDPTLASLGRSQYLEFRMWTPQGTIVFQPVPIEPGAGFPELRLTPRVGLSLPE